MRRHHHVMAIAVSLHQRIYACTPGTTLPARSPRTRKSRGNVPIRAVVSPTRLARDHQNARESRSPAGARRSRPAAPGTPRTPRQALPNAAEAPGYAWLSGAGWRNAPFVGHVLKAVYLISTDRSKRLRVLSGCEVASRQAYLRRTHHRWIGRLPPGFERRDSY